MDPRYQLSALAHRTTLVDNAAWNVTHVARVARTFALPEEHAAAEMRALDADYVVVMFGGLAGYGSDDVAKFLWMLRVAADTYADIHESAYMHEGEYRVDRRATAAMKDSLLYRLSYYRFGSMMTEQGHAYGFDRVRGVEIGDKHFSLDYFEEAHTTTNWLMRIYKLKPMDNRW